jgi:hypothetical protein
MSSNFIHVEVFIIHVVTLTTIVIFIRDFILAIDFMNIVYVIWFICVVYT